MQLFRTILQAPSLHLTRSYKMDNIKIVEIENSFGETQTHVIIDNGDGSFTSMLKSTWDELEAQREQSGTL